MPTAIPFFEKAHHKLAKLQACYPASPRMAALKLALWSLRKAAFGHILGDVEFIRSSRTGKDVHMAFLLRGGIGDIIINLAWIDALVSLANCPCHVDIYINPAYKNSMEALCYGTGYVAQIRTLKQSIPFSEYDAVFDVMQNPQVKAICQDRLQMYSQQLWAYTQRLLSFQSSHATFYLEENQAMGLHYADVMCVGGGETLSAGFRRLFRTEK